MAAKKGMGRYVYPASLVGISLAVMVGLAHLFGLLGRWLLQLAGADAAAGDALDGIEWLSGALSLLAALGTFIPALLLMLKSGKRVGLRLQLGRGQVPIAVLLPLFLGIMLALNSVTSLLRSMVGSIAGLPPVENAPLPATAFGRVLYFLSACLAAAVLEELVFRGGVQQLLRGWGSRFAIVVTSLLFTLMHANLWELPTVFALSLLLGYITEISGSVRPGMVLHFANNAFVFVVRLAGEQLETMTALALVLWLILVFLLLFGVAVWAVRSLKLGPKLRLARDHSPLGGVWRRFGRLFATPFFTMGFVVLAAHFVLRLTGL